MQLIPAVTAGVLAVQQHVERTADGRGRPGAVRVQLGQLGGHRGQLGIIRRTGIAQVLQARQDALAGPGLPFGRHTGQHELAGDRLGLTAEVPAARLGGRVHAGGPACAASSAPAGAFPRGGSAAARSTSMSRLTAGGSGGSP